VIGEVDFPSALTTVHEKAIYLHGGEQYHVEHLDFKERKAYVKRVDVDYYTDAVRYTQVRVLEVADKARGSEARPEIPAAKTHGDVLVRSQVVGFKKINFLRMKMSARENWNCRKTRCTHFLLADTGAGAGRISAVSISERQSGMFGLLHAMESVATLLLMCDGRDLGTAIGERPPAPGAQAEEFLPASMKEVSMADGIGATSKEFFEPNLYLFDAYPGGSGFRSRCTRARIAAGETRELICGLRLRVRLPFVRWTSGRFGTARQRGGAGDFRKGLRIDAALDKFARLAALRPAQSTTALRDNQPSPEESASAWSRRMYARQTAGRND